MLIGLFVLWILIWGTVGCFTVRAIRTYIEMKRVEREMAAWYAERMNRMRKYTDADGNVRYSLFPAFDGLV